MFQSKFLIVWLICIQLTYQENQNLIFFDSPMLWTKYVILTAPNYNNNNIYTYNVTIDANNGTSFLPSLTNVVTGVALAGFTSQVAQNFKFRMNQFFPSGVSTYMTLNWTVLSPSSFNYLSFTVIILQQDAQYLELFKCSYVNPPGLYNGGGYGDASSAKIGIQTKYNLDSNDQIYNFITSLQNFQNRPINSWMGWCNSLLGPVPCLQQYWDRQVSFVTSGILDNTHMWVQYQTQAFTYLYQMYSIHIIFHRSQYDNDHLYPYILDYGSGYGLNNHTIPPNMNTRYGPYYTPKCLLGHGGLGPGRFYPSLQFNVTQNGFQSLSFTQQSGYVQADIDFLCITAFQCDIHPPNSTNQSNHFYFPTYINCSSCHPDNVNANNCSQISYCINCVSAYDIPNNRSCQYCLSCNNYAYLLIGYCQPCNVTFQGCLMCTTNTIPSCTECINSEYYLGSSLCHLCNTTMIFCVNCNSSSICTSCFSPDDTHYLNQTTNKCELCSLVLNNCIKCYNNSSCIQCIYKYYVDQASQLCKPCNITNTYCVSCINDSYCLTCQTNYNLDQNGTCQFCDFFTTNCTQCTNDTTCTNCSLSYFLNYENQCSVCSKFIKGCYLCDNNKTCQECFQDYVLKSDQLCYYCALFIDQCSICKNASYCTTCLYGYYVNDNHTCTNCDVPMQRCVDCVVNDLCLDCSFGFYPNISECLLCKLQMSQCMDCVNATFCLQCTPDFIPINGTCQCRHGYLVTQMCNIILGCVSNHNISGVKRCLACNSNANFSYSNFNCSCKQGYEISGIWQNAVCVEICGDGKVIYLACDDGNLLDEDGCSSKCMVEPGYVCQNGSLWSRSICELMVDFAVSLYSIRRQDTINSGVVRLQINPVKQQLNNVQWMNFISLNIKKSKSSTASTFTSKTQQNSSVRLLSTTALINITGATFNQGIVSINFDYFESIQNFNALIEVQFDTNLFKASSQSLSFPMKSMNIPLTYQGYLNHHQILIILFYVIASLGLLQFLICLKIKNLVGVETLQVLQFFFFVKLLSDDTNPSLPYMNYPLSYANGFNFILSNQGRDYNMDMGMARLNIQPQFVLNLNISVLILLVLFCIRLYYQFSSRPTQTENTNKNAAVQLKEQKDEKQKLKNIYQNFILPLCLISIFLVMFSIASKFNIRNTYQTQVPNWLQSLTAMTAILSFFFVYFKQMKSLLNMPLLYSQQQEDEQNDYDQNYVAFNILFYLSSAITMITCKNKNYGIYTQGCLCIIYLLILFIERPYKQTYHNIGVIMNQIVVVLYFGLFVYINFFDWQLNVVLIWMYSAAVMFFIIIIFGFLRIYSSFKQQQENQFKRLNKRQKKTKNQLIELRKIKKKRRDQNPYLYENILKAQAQIQQNNLKKYFIPQHQNSSIETKLTLNKQTKHSASKLNELQQVKKALKQSLRNRRINNSQKLME